MKKLTYLSALVLAAGMTACSQYEEPNPSIAVTPSEEVLNVDGVSVEASSSITADEETGELANIDLDAYTKLGYQINIADVTVADGCLPEGYSVYFKTYFANNEDFENAEEVACNYANDVITVAPADLQTIYESWFGRKSDTQPVWVRVAAYADGSNVNSLRLNGSDYWYATTNFNLTPSAPDFTVEEAYYLLGTVNGWSVANALKMNHSDKDVYDDPTFSIVVEIDEATISANSGWWWKIVPQSVYETGDWVSGTDSQFGPVNNGETALSGALTGEDPGAGSIMDAGKYVLVINIEMMTYEFAPVYDCLYTPGDANGWIHSAAGKMYPDATGVYYQGWVMAASTGFKFTTQGDWNGINLGNSGEDGVLTDDGSAGNLGVSGETGLYLLKASPIYLTWEEVAGPISSWGVIGDFSGSDWSTDVTMTPTDDTKQVWTAEVTFAAGNQFKFRADGDWVVNYGGTSFDSLEMGGQNFVVSEAGTYTVTLDLAHITASIELAN